MGWAVSSLTPDMNPIPIPYHICSLIQLSVESSSRVIGLDPIYIYILIWENQSEPTSTKTPKVNSSTKLAYIHFSLSLSLKLLF